MNNNFFLKTALFALVVVLFSSCDDDANGIGSDIIGENNFNIVTQPYQISAYNHKLGPVQSSNLPLNPLGIYENPAFGTTTANFVTQVQWPANATIPTIDLTLDPQIVSAVLTVPYFSVKKSVGTDGVGIYDLDSIYAATGAKIKLSVYENRVFINGLDPFTLATQAYYTNQNSDFDGSHLGELLNDPTVPAQSSEFEFSNAEISEPVAGEADAKSAPAMRLVLKSSFFQTKLFGPAGTGHLSTNDQLSNHIRGLFFKAENSGANPAALARMNFKGGKITVKYKQDFSSTDHTVANRVEKTLVLGLTGNTVSLLEQSNVPTAYTDAINAPNPTDGDAKLYLKGGEGSMAIVSLFGPGELEALRASNRLINDATLTIYIDNVGLTTAVQPNRVYLFDMNNRTPLLDYVYDNTTKSDVKLNKYVHGGIIDKTNHLYKIKLTNHIRNLINDPAAVNVKLGLVVTESINDVTNVLLHPSGAIQIGVNANDLWRKFPQASVMNPFGTILFGTNVAPADAAKKMKFEISYTQPN